MRKSNEPVVAVTETELPAELVQRLPFLLYAAAEIVHGLANDALAPLGIGGRQFGILTVLAESGPQAQRTLGRLLQVDRSTMVGLVDALERGGLVERRRNLADRRAYAVRLTPTGHRVRRRALELSERCEEEFLAPLSDDERQQLISALSRLLEYARSRAQPSTNGEVGSA